MTTGSRKTEPPLRLDMSFAEAMTRFMATKPVEVSRQVAIDVARRRGTGMAALEWKKKLSTTDAQQPTTGGLVPYLRLTKGSLKSEDFQSWFREEFFANAAWAPGQFGREENLEISNIAAKISIDGVNFGQKAFTITHGPHRHESNNTPNTWLHWPVEIQSILHENDYTGYVVVLKRHENGSFELAISGS